MFQKQSITTSVSAVGGSSRLLRRLAAACGLLAIFCCSQTAFALPPTYSVIGPREFNLPIVKPRKGVSFFFQNAVYTNEDKAYDGNGNKVDAAKTKSFLGISRIGHVFSLPFTPNVGYYWEWLQPEAHINNDATRNTISGLGDSLFILAAYIKPEKNLIVGFNGGFTAPIGSNDLSFNYWSFQPNIFFDYSFGQFAYGKFGIDA